MYHGNYEMRVMVAIAISLDCISIGIVVKSIAISLDCASMGISSNQLQSAWNVYQWMSTVVLTVVSMSGSTVGLTVGSTVGLTVAVLGYQPQQSVQQLRQEAFTAISREGLTGSSLNKLIILQTL
jgi:putative Mn2+ efflux pump MntP